MKTFKKLMLLLLLVCSYTISSAQATEAKKNIVNKWVIDKEAMKPLIMTMLATNPQFAALDEASKASTLEMVLTQISGVKVEYKADGTMQRTDQNGDATGTWSLSEDGKELTTKAEGKPEKKTKILELTKTRLSMLSPDGKNIILKTE